MSRKKKKKVVYKLYAFEPTEEVIEEMQDKRFCRITTKYVLLYDRIQRTTNYNEIGEDELHYLSAADKQWLQDCNMAIIAEETERHKDKIAANMGLMLGRLEAALANEKAKELEEENAGKES